MSSAQERAGGMSGRSAAEIAWWEGERIGNRWCVHVLYEDGLGNYFTGPTLLAALEAAVRAVAGEDEQ